MQTTAHFRRTPLDSQRILAISGAIAANAMVAMLLIAPMAAPQFLGTDKEPTFYQPVVTPHPVPPIAHPVPVSKPHRQPDSTPHDKPAAHVEHESPPVDTHEETDTHVDQGAKTNDPHESIGITDPGSGDIGPPLAGAHLEYASAPPPPYPREAMLDGTTGTVLLQVRVGIDGKPIEVTISRSSGSSLLDAAARRQVLARWSFRPAMRDGQPVEAIGLVPVEFRLD